MSEKKKKKRRTKTSHPGVKMIELTYKSGKKSWVARWTDPDTKKATQTSMDQLGLTNETIRREWAIKKSQSLRARKAELASGAPLKNYTAIAGAIEKYLAKCAAMHRPATVRAYRKAAKKLLEWIKKTGLQYSEQLTLPCLSQFYSHLVSQPKRVPVKGGRKGAKRISTEKRSASGINSDLTSIKAMLNDWRRFGLVPKLSRDDIHDALRPLPTDKPRPKFLKIKEIRQLLESCLRHDSATFKMTRVEKQNGGDTGNSPRHDPIGQLVLFVLLSGCRIGEARTLRWSAVDLEAQAGKGEYILESTATKTREERAVFLAVTPILKVQLQQQLALKGDKDEYVFGGKAPYSEYAATKVRQRLFKDYGSPKFTWQTLRKTAGTFLSNSGGIFGGASAYRSARQLGHSVSVAERFYVGLVHVPNSAATLEEAMGIEDLVNRIVESINK
jgi:integrase